MWGPWVWVDVGVDWGCWWVRPGLGHNLICTACLAHSMPSTQQARLLVWLMHTGYLCVGMVAGDKEGLSRPKPAS